MPRTGIKLPGFVVLSAAPEMDAAAVRKALGVSKALLHLWRRDHGFPPFRRVVCDSFTSTTAIEAWLLERYVPVARADPLPPAPPVAPSPLPIPMPPGYAPQEHV
jgi:hypothetical protein